MPDRPSHVTALSSDIMSARMEKLRELFPEAIGEDGLDFDKLRATLGDFVDDAPERYTFSWAGKRDAIRLLQMPTRATLLPTPEEALDWDTTANLFIEGENLETLKLLLRPYYGRVKMIYIDPPYNTGNDFIYPDDYRDPLGAYLEQAGQVAGQGDETHRNRITSGRRHSGWLSMMYPRLWLAHQLLRDDGVIFVSIDDNEVHNLRMLMNELFGEENLLAQLIWVLSTTTQAGHFTRAHEYVLAFGKDKAALPNFPLWEPGNIVHGALKRISRANPASDIDFPAGLDFEGDSAVFEGELGGSEKQIVLSERMVFENGKLKHPVRLRAGWAMRNQLLSWLEGKPTYDTKGQRVVRFFFSRKGILCYEKERGTFNPRTVLNDVGDTKGGSAGLEQLFGRSVMDFPKPPSLLAFLCKLVTRSDDVSLDFFAGSCTTAQAVLELNREDGGNRRFIMIQLPEPTENPEFPTIAEIGKERIRRVIARMEEEDQSKAEPAEHERPEDLGFRVFKLALSNYRNWAGVAAEDTADLPDDYARQMELYADGLRDGWEPGAVIAEVSLKEAGFGLGYAVKTLGESLWRVTDRDTDRFFYIILSDEVHLEDLEPLGLDKETLLVCRATALDDTTAGNLQLQCRLRVI